MTVAHMDTKLVASQLLEGGEEDVLRKIRINDSEHYL